MIDILFLITALCVGIAIGTINAVHRRLKEEKRYFNLLERAMSACRCGELDRGTTWTHKKSGRTYTILYLTNVDTDRPGWEINVTYTHDFLSMYTRPLSEFYAKFVPNSEQDNRAAPSIFDLMSMVSHRIDGKNKLIRPQAGEFWEQITTIPVPDKPSVEIKTKALVEDIFALDTAQPIVVYSVNGVCTAKLLFQFTNLFRKIQDESATS